MIDPLLLLIQVAILVLMILPGFLLKKMGLMPGEAGKVISNIVLYAAQVALIIAGFCTVNFSTQVLLRMLAVFLLAVVTHLLFYFVGRLIYRKAPDEKRRVLVFSTVFTNAGYMGIPLLVALFATEHPEVAIYGSVYVAAFNVFLWSLGAFLYTEDKSYISVKKMFINPATIATFIGLAIFLLSAIPAVRTYFIDPVIRNEKGVIFPLMNNLKGLVAPLSMFVIGLRLTAIKVRDVIRDKYLYLNLAFSLILLPVLIFGILKLLSVTGIYHDPLTASVLMISASAPAATATSMFAEKFDGDSPYAGLTVSVTSILCVVTMPLVCALTLLY